MQFIKTFMAGAAALTLIGSTAMAQPVPGQQPPMAYGHQGYQNHQGYQDHQSYPDHQGYPSHQAYQNHRPSNGHQWHQGDHFSDNRVIVHDYNHYHLRPPPEGYQWVNSGGQFLLIAVASGIIASVIAGSMH